MYSLPVAASIMDIAPELPEEGTTFLDSLDWPVVAVAALLAVIMVRWSWGKLRRAMRRRGPGKLHPNLQRYGQQAEEMTAQRRIEAARILATSSTPGIVGYEIIEQVEAVFVDGFRRPEDALEGLKALAAMKGANAVANVRHDQGTSNSYKASGDAVIVRRVQADSDGSNPESVEPETTQEEPSPDHEPVEGVQVDPWPGDQP